MFTGLHQVCLEVDFGKCYLACPAGGSSAITQQQLELMLEAARWAPTHKLTEPWHFVVLSGSSKAEFEVSKLVVEQCTDHRMAAARCSSKWHTTNCRVQC